MEYRIEPDALSRRRETRIRFASWSTVMSLFAIPAVIFVLRFRGMLTAQSNLRWFVALSLLGAVVGSCIIAGREGLRRVQREMVFVMDENGVVRKRKGWPDVRIAFSEVDAIREEPRTLVVESTEPGRKIVIPNEVKGFEAIRAELANRRPISAHAESSFRASGIAVISLVSWAALLWLRDIRLIFFCGAIVLIVLALATHRLWPQVHRSRKRLFYLIWLGFAWIVAVLLIYVRVVLRR